MARFLAGTGHVTRAALVYITNSDSLADGQVEQGFRDGLASVGVAVGKIFKEQPTQPTYDDVVSQIELDNDNGVVTILDPTAYQRFLASENQAAFHPTDVADPLFDTPAVVSTSGSDGTYVASDFDFLENRAAGPVAYVNAVHAEFGADAPTDWLGEVGWLGAQQFVQALAKLGNTITRPALLQALTSLSGENNGFTRPLIIAGANHDMNRCLKLGKISNGVLSQVRDWACDSEKA